MKSRTYFAAILLMLPFLACAAQAGSVNGMQQAYVCDATTNQGNNCLKPNSDGSINTTASAGTAIIGKVTIDQTTDGTTNKVAISSAFNNVGGYEFNVQDTPTVQNAAYSASNCMGGFRTLTVSRTASGGIILDNFSVRTITGITPTIQVVLFTANPAASTCTDKSTFTINSADVDKIPAGGVFQVTLSQPQGSTPSFGAVTNLAISMNANSSSQIYYALVATASTTPGSVSDIHVSANGLQD